jgi:hypothetical protein
MAVRCRSQLTLGRNLQDPHQPGPKVCWACTKASRQEHHSLQCANHDAACAGGRLRRLPVVRRFAKGFESNQAAWDAYWADHKAPAPPLQLCCLHATSLPLSAAAAPVPQCKPIS